MDKATEQYEIGYLLRPTLGEENSSEFLEKFGNVITKNGGLITFEGRPRKQILAYPIKKESSAIFNWIRFSAKPQSVKEIKNSLDSDPLVLRFLIMKTKEEKKVKRPSVMKSTLAIQKSLPVEAEKKTKKETEKDAKIQEEEIDKKIEELLGES